jgi:hypothetical protein
MYSEDDIWARAFDGWDALHSDLTFWDEMSLAQSPGGPPQLTQLPVVNTLDVATCSGDQVMLVDDTPTGCCMLDQPCTTYANLNSYVRPDTSPSTSNFKPGDAPTAMAASQQLFSRRAELELNIKILENNQALLEAKRALLRLDSLPDSMSASKVPAEFLFDPVDARATPTSAWQGSLGAIPALPKAGNTTSGHSIQGLCIDPAVLASHDPIIHCDTVDMAPPPVLPVFNGRMPVDSTSSLANMRRSSTSNLPASRSREHGTPLGSFYETASNLDIQHSSAPDEDVANAYQCSTKKRKLPLDDMAARETSRFQRTLGKNSGFIAPMVAVFACASEWKPSKRTKTLDQRISTQQVLAMGGPCFLCYFMKKPVRTRMAAGQRMLMLGIVHWSAALRKMSPVSGEVMRTFNIIPMDMHGTIENDRN